MQNNACMLYKGKIASNKYYLWCTMKKLKPRKRPKKTLIMVLIMDSRNMYFNGKL